jgi:hypothetical protein
MSKWSKWVDIESAKSKKGSFNDFGVYEVRAVNQSNSPIPINRFIGTDPLGILYIGRSGYGGKTARKPLPTGYENSFSGNIRAVLRTPRRN